MTNQIYNRNYISGKDCEAGKLPLLISVPHGGKRVPEELRPLVALNSRDIFPDSDPYTKNIYNFQNEVVSYHETDIARAIIDLNRREDDLPPSNVDGVIKSQTVTGEDVYNVEPDNKKIQEMLRRYYYPYHSGIREAMEDNNLLCGFDCHSMLDVAPHTSSTAGEKRPFICLSNCGDENGESDGGDITCSPELLILLADCLRRVFPEEAENILLNEPFKGGHISRDHSDTMPWIQIEINRRAYLKPRWFDSDTLQVDAGRLEFLRQKFLRALVAFCDEAGHMQFSYEHSGYQYSESGYVIPSI